MERTLSLDEKIRRAEEIYYRRKQKNYDNSYEETNIEGNEKYRLKLIYKIFIQSIICTLLYTGIYYAKYSENIFLKEITPKINQILAYDIDFQKIYEKINFVINKNFASGTVQNTSENTIVEYSNEEVQEENIENTDTDEAIINMEEIQELTQEEKDAESILSNHNFINPLPSAVVTSEFGERASSNPQVTPYHTGIDLGENEGTTIVAAMEGTAEVVSSVGDYRKSFKSCKW